MVFAAYEFVQKRAQKKERERIKQELEALVSKGDGSAIVSPEDIERITRSDRE